MTLTATQADNLQKKFKTSFGQKMKKLANKTSLFYFEDDKGRPSIQVSFEGANYDFDTLDTVLDLNKGIKSKVLFSRSVNGTFEDVQVAVTQMLDNVRTIDATIFNKRFAKEFVKFTDDLRMAYATLNSI